MAFRIEAIGDGLTRTTGIVAASSDFTCCVWWRRTGPLGIRTLFLSIDNPDVYADVIEIVAFDGNPNATVGAYVGVNAVYTSMLPDDWDDTEDAWAFYVYRRTGNLHEFIVNNLIIGTTTVDISSNTLTQNWLGENGLVENLAEGEFARYREWDAALSDPELLQEYQSGTAIRTANLIADTPLIDDFFDISGNGNHWHEVGGSPFGSPAGSPNDFVDSPEIPNLTPGVPTNPPLNAVEEDTDVYSDWDMHCPPAWYHGYKEARVERFGDGERTLSDPLTGDWQGSQFSLRVSDHDLSIRQRLASETERFWIDPLVIRMTTRENRAALGVPYTVFVGPLIDAQPVRPLAWDLTLGDMISQGIMADDNLVPWRLIRDGFLSLLTMPQQLSPPGVTPRGTLDADAPEPIIYGRHIRVPEVDPASPQGFVYVPQYLGIGDVGTGDDRHVWIVAGHACADIPEMRVQGPDDPLPVSVLADEGTEWLIPHHSGWTAEFGDPYVDLRSDTYGNLRRYTLILGTVTDLDAEVDMLTDPDACALGHKSLQVSVEGMELNGDGSGDVVEDRFQQYKHFCINYLANRGRESYQSGAYLDNPTWDLFEETVEMVEEETFDNASAIGVERMPAPPAPHTYPAGYIGAAIIGANGGDRGSAKHWIAKWNRSSACRFGITRLGQMRIALVHPTLEDQASAPLYTDAYEILRDSFQARVDWGAHANRIPYVADWSHVLGKWTTAGIADWGSSISNYGKAITGAQREYPFAPGETMAFHLARLEVIQHQHPPRFVTLEATVGPDPQDDSLGYRELGDYIRYQAYPAVANLPSEIRLAQVQKVQVQAGARRVLVEALDVHDFVDVVDVVDGAPAGDVFDEPDPVVGTVVGNFTCNTAVVINQQPFTPLSYSLDTTDHPTDATVPGSFTGTAYHAAWWQYTPPEDGTLFLNTTQSNYDTHMAVFSGGCGSLSLVAYNDNNGVLNTSLLELPVTGGVPLFILVAGVGASDGGNLRFRSYFAEPESVGGTPPTQTVWPAEGVIFREDFTDPNANGQNQCNFSYFFGNAQDGGNGSGDVNADGGSWSVDHMPTGNYDGGPCMHIHKNEIYTQGTLGWAQETGFPEFSMGDAVYVRIRFRLDNTWRFQRSSYPGSWQMENKFFMMGGSSTPASRFVIFMQGQQSNFQCMLAASPSNPGVDTSPAGFGLAAPDWDDPSIAYQFGSISAHVNIDTECAGPTLIHYGNRSPAVAPAPGGFSAAPVNGWYHLQVYVKSGLNGTGEFKIWVNNNTFASPSAVSPGVSLGVTGWNNGFQIGGNIQGPLTPASGYRLGAVEVGRTFDPNWKP